MSLELHGQKVEFFKFLQLLVKAMKNLLRITAIYATAHSEVREGDRGGNSMSS